MEKRGVGMREPCLGPSGEPIHDIQVGMHPHGPDNYYYHCFHRRIMREPYTSALAKPPPLFMVRNGLLNLVITSQKSGITVY